jgi:indole-3-glycerol phosphate synthase
VILDELVACSRQRVATARSLVSLDALGERVAREAPPAGPSFEAALRAPGVSLIAEIKRTSPSRGALNATLDPREQALRYAHAAADAISVLTGLPPKK